MWVTSGRCLYCGSPVVQRSADGIMELARRAAGYFKVLTTPTQWAKRIWPPYEYERYEGHKERARHTVRLYPVANQRQMEYDYFTLAGEGLAHPV